MPQYTSSSYPTWWVSWTALAQKFIVFVVPALQTWNNMHWSSKTSQCNCFWSNRTCHGKCQSVQLPYIVSAVVILCWFTGDDRSLMLWGCQNGELRQKVSLNKHGPAVRLLWIVNAVARTRKSSILFLGCADGTIHQFDYQRVYATLVPSH